MGDSRRWPSATAISITLHGLLVLATWHSSSRWGSPAERKRLLFELWDECEEPDQTGSDIDDTRTELARAARKKILRYIAKVAPAGSPEAFSKTELAQLNARRVSKQVFAPYE